MKRVEMKTLVKDTLFELFSDAFKGTSKKVKFICEHYTAGGMSLKLSSYSYSVGVNVFYSGEVSYYKAYDHQLPPTEVGGLFLSSVVERLKADSLPKDSVL